MKIAFDHHLYGLEKYCGIARYAYELAVELATSLAQEVTVISPLYANRYLANAPRELAVVGVHAPELPNSGRLYRAINSLLAQPILRYIRPDIVHETYYSSRRLAPRRVRVVLTVYDMILEKISDYASMHHALRQHKARAVARADHVICISEQTRRDVIELLGVDPAKTSVVHLGFTLTRQRESAEKAGTPTRPFLLYVGYRVSHKNFDRLLQAYASSAALRNDFDLICFGGGQLTDREMHLIQRLGLSMESVRQVSGDDALLARYYRTARAVVYPSLYEGFGIPPLEAMSFDCPVVCSGVSSIPEVVGDAGEMFDPYDVDSIRTAIERVVGDDALRRHLIACGRERIKRFSWKRCAQETLDVYRRVLS
jgi:glycosyltransferase involved in cell wall biosynthesis